MVKTAPQNRSIFLGMDVGSDDLQGDTVEGANPLADVRVRRAMDLAIDREAIRQIVMRGQSRPAGMIAPPFVRGHDETLDQVTQPDLAQAEALLEEAGHADGFGLTLDCPNDRYINDEAICQAVAGMLGRAGIEVTLNAMPKAQFFPLVTGAETEFYLLGWGVPTYDSEYIFNFLVHTRGEDRGSWNATGYSNPDLDAKIVALSSEIDEAARDASVAEIWEVVQEEVLYLPIHDQVLNWGMAENVGIEVSPEDDPKIKYIAME